MVSLKCQEMSGAKSNGKPQFIRIYEQLAMAAATLGFEQTRSLDGERRRHIFTYLPSYRWRHFCMKENIFHFQTPNDIYWIFGVY